MPAKRAKGERSRDARRFDPEPDAAIRGSGGDDAVIVDLVVELARPTERDEVNAAFRAAAEEGALLGILRYAEEPLVSSDIVGSPYSCIFDSELTMTSGSLVKVFGWYDNEWGYSCRLVDLVGRLQ
jgi:glyceraldehyde 3-phosphate dehydrogenase